MKALDEIAAQFGIDSVLIMESTPTHMVTRGSTPNGVVTGTLCALHSTPFDFDQGNPSLREALLALRERIERGIIPLPPLTSGPASG